MSKYRIQIEVDDADYQRLSDAGEGDVERGVRRALRSGVLVTTKQNEGADVLIRDKATGETDRLIPA